MRRGAITLAFLLTFAVPASLAAQAEAGAPPSRSPGLSQAQVDSIFPRPPISAGGAFFRSLVLPGWAQTELGSEARGAFYFFAEAFSLFMVARTQIRLNEAERTLPEGSGLIDARKQQREDWLALAVFWAFFSGADGWVSVHLYGFEQRTGLKPEDVTFLVGWKIPVGP
jgi:hypothetical protein